MSITIPVPTLGDVIVLTSVGEQVETGCTFPGSTAPLVKNYRFRDVGKHISDFSPPLGMG